jgi:hypothetical protein
MSRTSLLALGLGLAAASLGAAGISAPTMFFKISVDRDQTRAREYARVTDGRLALTERGGWSDWEDRMDARPDRWYVLGTKIKSSVGGGYLAYDPSGEDPRVFLSREAGEGTDWTIGDRNEGQNYVRYGLTQAASGKVKGWYLDVEDCEEKGEDGKATAARRLVLRKDAVRTKVHVTQLYSYRATAP